jgi:hypothetical protein
MIASRAGASADIHRLLRHAARRRLEELEKKHEAVDPCQIAERLVDAHCHLAGVRAYRQELQVAVEDYVRELRARDSDEPSG